VFTRWVTDELRNEQTDGRTDSHAAFMRIE